jgi:hypothetical protein
MQVVAAAPGQTITGRPTNQLLTIDSLGGGRQQVSVTLASALGGNIKMTGGTVTPAQQQAILSHVSTSILVCPIKIGRLFGMLFIVQNLLFSSQAETAS